MFNYWFFVWNLYRGYWYLPPSVAMCRGSESNWRHKDFPYCLTSWGVNNLGGFPGFPGDRTISSPSRLWSGDGVGRSWQVYCWDSLASLYTFSGNIFARPELGSGLPCPGLYRNLGFPEFTRFAPRYFYRGDRKPVLCSTPELPRL